MATQNDKDRAVEDILGSVKFTPGAAYRQRLHARLHQEVTSGAGEQRRGLLQGLRLRPTFAILAVCVLAVGLLAFVPAVRAAVADFAQGFGLIDPKQLENSTFVAGERFTSAPYYLSLAEIQGQAPFGVRSPAWLPDGISFKGCLAGTKPEQKGEAQSVTVVSLYYASEEAPEPAGILLNIISDGSHSGFVVDTTQVEEITVQGNPAAIIQGGWQETDTGLAWDENADQVLITWEQDGLTYELVAIEIHLSAEEVLKIAESIQ